MKWSTEEKQMLLQAVQLNTDSSNRVDWTAVTQLIPCRSKNQCQTQYQQVLQCSKKHVNHMWAYEENQTLYTTV